MHIVLLKCQIAFLKFTSCDNQVFVGCIPIAAIAVYFLPEIIKIDQSSHKMYSNKILNFQESTTILNAHTKKVWKLIVCTSYIRSIYSLIAKWPWSASYKRNIHQNRYEPLIDEFDLIEANCQYVSVREN